MGEEPGEETVVIVSEAHLEDVQGWGGTKGSGVGDNGFPPVREGGLSGNRTCGGGLEGLCGGGEFSAKAERDPT